MLSTQTTYLFQKAQEYDLQGDHYHAVKIYKKIIKLAPAWAEPYRCMGEIYKARKEWKPSFYYTQKALENNPSDEVAWWNLGIIATALKKWQLARVAWNRVGYALRENDKAIELELGAVPIRLNPKSQPEIVWAHRIDPVRARIASIPAPSSRKCFRDLILFDTEHRGFRILKGKRIPVYDELQVIKTSGYETYQVTLETTQFSDIKTLDQLCLDADLGFDNWTKATKAFVNQDTDSLPEYYNEGLHSPTTHSHYVVAMAALSEQDVLEVLNNWRLITLQNFTYTKL